jgi:transposase-like protein
MKILMQHHCPYCLVSTAPRSENCRIHRTGKYWRKSDGRWILRFWCEACKRGFSNATAHPCYQQKKRHKNELVKKLLCGGVSQREAARMTGLNRKTIVRKLLYWAMVAEAELNKLNQQHSLCEEVEFDDLETFEHTKCKPLSVTLMVVHKTRRILGFEVARMPAKGLLAAISRKKYGYRRDERPEARKRLFLRMKRCVRECAVIRSDSNPHYPSDVKTHFPKAHHQTIKGKRGAITGQGELKKVHFDPLFSLNHTCAMFRANVNRLIRKT